MSVQSSATASVRLPFTRARRARSLLAAALVTTVSGCLPADHPRRYPAVLSVVQEGGQRAWATDLNGDGVDEGFLMGGRHRAWPATGPERRLLFHSGGAVVDQTNYDAEILEPEFADIVGDGRLEVIVPLLRNDSLFFSVASAEGRKLFAFLVATGEPRLEPDGELPWDPRVTALWVADVDGDGDRELVTALSTGYARYPRGILIHSLPEGEVLGEALVGAPPVSALLSDFDGDGLPEVLAASAGTLHGADRGGFSDSESYLMLYDLGPPPGVTWFREDSRGSPELGWTDHDGDGRREVVAVRGQGSLQAEILDPSTLRVVRRREIVGRYFTPALIDLDRDLQPEIVASRIDANEVVMLDHDLRSVRRVATPFPTNYAYAWPDLDGDGIHELELRTGNGFALLGPDLDVKAIVPDGAVTGVERRGNGTPSRLLIESGGTALVAELRPNPWFLFVRYGPAALAVLVPLSLWLLVSQIRSLRYRLRVVHAVGVEALEAGGRGLMVVDARGRIRWRGSGLGPAFRSKPSRVPDLDRLADVEPSLAAWCLEVVSARPARPRTGTVTLNGDEGGRDAKVSMSPVLVGSSHDPHWLVALDGAGRDGDGTWPMMAHRIVHAVKNPLTHMLLTVQRLQAEYRERAPAVASRLDPYADRIQDGIGQLRRLTSNFLKLADLADPELEEVDVGALVTEFGDDCRARLPHDIRLRIEVTGVVPRALVDRDQVVVALDNLVTNSVNALEVGGTITLAVTAHSRMWLEGDAHPRDYVLIEVMDTGRGIPTEVRSQVFEPGFSTAEDGSGLGLAIVRKVMTDHGGRVFLESDPGVGTVFTLYIPAVESKVEGDTA